VLAFNLLSRRVTLTAKLFHDPDYPSHPWRHTFLTCTDVLSGFARLQIGNTAADRDRARGSGHEVGSATQSDG